MFAEKLMLMKRFLLALLFCPLLAFAQTGEENIIELEEPNTLSEYADETLVTNAYKLTIKGPMSNDDWKFLSENMYISTAAKEEDFDSYIKWLDLSEAKAMPLYGDWMPDRLLPSGTPTGRSQGHKYYTYPTPADELPPALFPFSRSLHHIQLPKVRFVEMGLLCYADALEELMFQEGLDSIATKVAMMCTSIKQVYLPATLMYIGGSFLIGAHPYKMVCAAPIPPELFNEEVKYIQHPSFYSIEKGNCDLYVPYGSKALYEAAEQWRDFRSITECDTEKMREEMEPGSKQTGVEAHSTVTGTTAVYDLRGVQQKGLRRGLNIVRSGDGKARLMIQSRGK